MSLAHITDTTLPALSALQGFISSNGFQDCVFVPANTAKLTSDKAAFVAFNQMPKKSLRVIKLRNLLAKFYGCLSWKFNALSESNYRGLRARDTLNQFTVLRVNPGEVILAKDDEHLVTRISIYKAKAGYTVSTCIEPRTITGQKYLNKARELHTIIAKSMLENIVRA